MYPDMCRDAPAILLPPPYSNVTMTLTNEGHHFQFKVNFISPEKTDVINFIFQRTPFVVFDPSIAVEDIYPLNGNFSRILNPGKLIPSDEREKISHHAQLIGKGSGQRCIVIDYKSGGAYEKKEFIHSLEDRVIQLFRPQKAFENLIRDNAIRFIIKEGTLKANLISTVLTNQKIFLQEEPSGVFCKLCEVVMNFFKQGFSCTSSDTQFNPRDYVVPVDEDYVYPSNVDSKNTTPLVTLYSPHYQEMYGEDEAYCQMMEKVFSVGHEILPGSVTKITLGEKV